MNSTTQTLSNHLTQKEVNQEYKYWRLHIFLGIYFGYAAFYLTRKSFNFAVPAMIEDLGFSKSDIGLMATLFYLCYGMSKFLSGIISDRTNPRYFMGTGLILTGIINILFGLSSSVTVFTILWVFNAWFQGWGWPPCSKYLTTWYSRTERGVWWCVWNTAINLGGALTPIIIATATYHFGWRYGFSIVGCIAIVIGLLLFWRLRNTPQSMGLPSIGKWRKDHLELKQESEGRNLTFKQRLIQYVLANKYIWLLAFSYLFVYMVRTAINDWGNIYLTEVFHYDIITANGALSLFEVGGFCGSLVAGWGSDKLFSGNRGPLNLLFALGLFISVAALWLMPLAVTGYIFQSIVFFCIGFFVFGPQMLIGMAAAETSHKTTPGSATGFVGLFAYLGAALAGYPLAMIMNAYHWNGFFITVSICSFASALLLLPFLNAQQTEKH